MGKEPKVMAKYKLAGCDIVLTFGQIMNEDVDAIVLVANSKKF
jgi:riboflavin synthase